MDKLKKADDLGKPRPPVEDWGGTCELVTGCTEPVKCAIHKQCQIERMRERQVDAGGR